MKKLAFLLIFLSVTRIGVAYAEDSVANISGSYFFGTSTTGAADVVNGVLALLIGPEGKPGLLGPEGKSAYDVAKANGFTGTEAQWLVSLTGKDGDSAYDIAVKGGFQGTKEDWLRSLIGTPGPAGTSGVAGTGVTVTNEASGANCSNGGYKLTSATGVAYVCNGSNGTGGGGGGTTSDGKGLLTVGACTDTATVGVKSQFTGTDFVMNNLTISGLQSGCAGKTLNFYYTIDSNTATVLKNPAGVYTHGNVIKCTLDYPATTATKVPASNTWGAGTTNDPQLTITSSNSTCRVVGGSTDFDIDKISTADYTNLIAIEILSS